MHVSAPSGPYRRSHFTLPLTWGSLLAWTGLTAGSSPAIAEPTAAADALRKARASVMQVVVERVDGPGWGSAVQVDAAHAVTSCHVLGDSNDALVGRGPPLQRAVVAARDEHHDLCLLTVKAGVAQTAVRRSAQSVSVGEASFAMGYGGARFSVTRGAISARYPFDGAPVLRTKAAFAAGASGGGLFDAEGRLLGILTFYRRTPSQAIYLAVPSDWLTPLLSGSASQAQAPGAASGSLPFWDRDPHAADTPRFMQALNLEAAERWGDLQTFALRWMAEVPSDAEGACAMLAIARQVIDAPLSASPSSASAPPDPDGCGPARP